ncbi:3-oxoadipate CoA-transferase subunit B [Patulibacter medicamentivorans]|uniref:3-oxoadipate CoA-transferase subunit B n=1 Tax=Patulibacter medicamentivorans TaxID=1097667 RepID=H0EA44_9ACTN|nr:3-oxoadipate CoA-transferase subunit B [Patulibacter medicamentivorans]
MLTQLLPGATVEAAREATGWPLRIADAVEAIHPPTDHELTALRELVAR